MTGWDVDIEEILKVGERRLNMLRAFNSREGSWPGGRHSPQEAVFPTAGGGQVRWPYLDRDEWEAALEEYYRLCKWSAESGHPSREKLEALGLGWVVTENETLAGVI